MTIEVRQMVIKSNISSDAVKAEPASGDRDEPGSTCGSGREGASTRATLIAELDRLRER